MARTEEAESVCGIPLNAAPKLTYSPLRSWPCWPGVFEERFDFHIGRTLSNGGQVCEDFLGSMLIEGMEEAQIALVSDPKKCPLPQMSVGHPVSVVRVVGATLKGRIVARSRW